MSNKKEEIPKSYIHPQCGKHFKTLEEALDQGEIWKEIKRCPGYIITNKAKVISTCNSHYPNEFYVLTPTKKNDYVRVSLKVDKKTKDWLLHRLVACTFIPIPEAFQKLGYTEATLQVNHIDGNKERNEVENLEWMTPEANNILAGSDTIDRWDSNSISVFSSQGNYITSYPSFNRAFEALNIKHNNIKALITLALNKDETALDFYWRTYNSKYKEGYNLFDKDEKRNDINLEEFRYATEYKPVVQLDLITNNYINTYSSIYTASQFLKQVNMKNNNFMVLAALCTKPIVITENSKFMFEEDYRELLNNK